MSTIISIANKLGKSPDAVYKLIRGDREAKPEEKALLTDALGRDAGAAYDLEAVNEKLRAENERLTLAHIELTAENQRHVRGLKISLIGARVFLVGCAALVLVVYAPIVANWLGDRNAGLRIRDAEIVQLKRTVMNQARVIDDYRSTNKTRDDTERMYSEMFNEIDKKITEVEK